MFYNPDSRRQIAFLMLISITLTLIILIGSQCLH